VAQEERRRRVEIRDKRISVGGRGFIESSLMYREEDCYWGEKGFRGSGFGEQEMPGCRVSAAGCRINRFIPEP
jgi:hypothetical protein